MSGMNMDIGMHMSMNIHGRRTVQVHAKAEGLVDLNMYMKDVGDKVWPCWHLH